MALLAVTGLRAEAALAREAGCLTVCAGGVPARTEAALESALAGADLPAGIISFGLAGGLAPDLRPGTLLLPDEVVTEAGARYPVDAAWRGTVAGRVAAWPGAILGAVSPAISETAKSALFRRTGALAIDLESLVVARAAAQRDLPFLVLRAIADPADRDLPAAALIPLRPDGAPALGPILASLARDPRQLGGLIRLALDTRRAMVALRQAARALSA